MNDDESDFKAAMFCKALEKQLRPLLLQNPDCTCGITVHAKDGVFRGLDFPVRIRVQLPRLAKGDNYDGKRVV